MVIVDYYTIIKEFLFIYEIWPTFTLLKNGSNSVARFLLQGRKLSSSCGGTTTDAPNFLVRCLFAKRPTCGHAQRARACAHVDRFANGRRTRKLGASVAAPPQPLETCSNMHIMPSIQSTPIDLTIDAKKSRITLLLMDRLDATGVL